MPSRSPLFIFIPYICSSLHCQCQNRPKMDLFVVGSSLQVRATRGLLFGLIDTMSAVDSGAITPLLRTSGLACCPWAQVNHYVEGSTKSDKRPSITSYHNARPYTYLHQGWRRSICRRCARPAAARPETSRLDTPYPVSVRLISLAPVSHVCGMCAAGHIHIALPRARPTTNHSRTRVPRETDTESERTTHT